MDGNNVDENVGKTGGDNKEDDVEAGGTQYYTLIKYICKTTYDYIWLQML